MKNTVVIALSAAFALSFGIAVASDYSEEICVSQASAEGWENGEELCSCLAGAASEDAQLSKELAALQALSAADRVPENFTPKVADAVESCSA